MAAHEGSGGAHQRRRGQAARRDIAVMALGALATGALALHEHRADLQRKVCAVVAGDEVEPGSVVQSPR